MERDTRGYEGLNGYWILGDGVAGRYAVELEVVSIPSGGGDSYHVMASSEPKQHHHSTSPGPQLVPLEGPIEKG